MAFFRVLIFFAILLPAPAFSAQLTGDYLIHVCGEDSKGKELVAGGHITCQAYIAGVVDYHNLIKSMDAAPSVDFCVPQGTTLYDLQKIVLRYLALNRQQHGAFIASPGVALALYQAFPCRKRR